jgi:hypothetical protein
MVPLSFGIGLITASARRWAKATRTRALRGLDRGGDVAGVRSPRPPSSPSSAGRLRAPTPTTRKCRSCACSCCCSRRCSSCPTPTQVATSSAIRGYKVTRPPMLIQLLAFWGVVAAGRLCAGHWRRPGCPVAGGADGGHRLLDRPGAGADGGGGAAVVGAVQAGQSAGPRNVGSKHQKPSRDITSAKRHNFRRFEYAHSRANSGR